MDNHTTAATTNANVDKRKQLRLKIAQMNERRAGPTRAAIREANDAAKNNDIKKPDQKKLKKKIKSQKIDDILAELGITDNEIKTQLIQAMSNGRIKNVADLSSWLALHAPMSQIRPQDALAVRQASDAAEREAQNSLSSNDINNAGESSNSVRTNETGKTRNLRKPTVHY